MSDESPNPNERDIHPNIETKEFPKISEIPDNCDGWLDPDGSFYPCKSDEHEACAKFIVNKKIEELKNTVPPTPTSEAHARILASRLKSGEARLSLQHPYGFLLVNNKTVVTDRFLNLTQKQLRTLREGSINVVDLVEISKKFNPEDALKYSESLRIRIEKFMKTKEFTRMELGTSETRPPIYRKETIVSTRAFLESPLTTTIRNEELLDEDDREKFSKKLFQILTEDWDEQLNITKEDGLVEYRFISTKDSNIKILVIREEHIHDGKSGNTDGAVRYTVNSMLVTKAFWEDYLHNKGRGYGGSIIKTEVLGKPNFVNPKVKL